MKANKQEGVWKSLRIAIILLVANLLLVTNLYIYSMYVSNQSMEMALSAQSSIENATNKSSATAPNKKKTIDQALSYDIPEGYQVNIKSIVWPLGVEAMKNRTEDCGSAVSNKQIENVADAYRGVKGLEYTFTKNGSEGEYVMTVYPNKRFSGIDEANEFLAVCSNGGQLSPKAVSQSALLFEDNCGTSMNSSACERIKATIEPMLTIE